MKDNHNNGKEDFFENNFFEDDDERKPRVWARSVSNTVIGGVCGGIGEYFNVEPNLFRIVFVLGTLAGGWGIVVYIAALFFVPIIPDPDQHSESEIDELLRNDNQTIFGSLLILTGIYFIISPTGFFLLFSILGVSNKLFVTMLILSAGIKLIRPNGNFFKTGLADKKHELWRSKEDRRLMGVCGGLAKYLNTNSTLVRIIGILSIILTAGISIVVYFIFSSVLTFEPELISNDE